MKRKRVLKKANPANAPSMGAIVNQTTDAASEDQRTNYEEQPIPSDPDPRHNEEELNVVLMVCQKFGTELFFQFYLWFIDFCSDAAGLKYWFLYFVTLQVIKKIMSMDGTAPFNVPVNPIVLGVTVSMKRNSTHIVGQ